MQMNKSNPTKLDLRGEIATLTAMLDADVFIVRRLSTLLKQAYDLLKRFKEDKDVQELLDEIKGCLRCKRKVKQCKQNK